MSIQDAYNSWAAQYDSNENKTRDAEAKSLRQILSDFAVENCLEIGCGTGKNTEFLLQIADRITAVDFSEEMLAKAEQKITSDKVQFVQADITNEWQFATRLYDLITFSLVLEHIEDLEPLFQQAAARLSPGGTIYVGELHPFKQYSGSKARFETEKGTQILTCFVHHISDFTTAAKNCGLQLQTLNEYFDEEEKTGLPRLLTILFRKPVV